METIATIAAGMFAILDRAPEAGKNGNSEGIAAVASNWKQKGRSEALR
jgi:hypothetical protein